MRHQSLILFFNLITCLVIFSSCKQQSAKGSGAAQIAYRYEKEVIQPVVVRLETERSSVLAEIKLKFSGSKKIEAYLDAQKETVQSLVIQTVSGFSYSDLRSNRGQSDFQKQLLSSINQFVGNNHFEDINIVELKEI